MPLWRVGAAAFTSGGDSLFAMGEHFVGSAYPLYSIDAATGVVRDSAIIPYDFARYYQAAMAVDPVGPWLYVARGADLTAPGGDVVVRVFDRHTLVRVGEAHAPRTLVDGQMFYWNLIVGADRILYLTMNCGGYAVPNQPAIYRFSLMP